MVYREGKASGATMAPRSRVIVLALGALYLAQGIPFGLATEYLPVVLREAGTSYTMIAALGWLQLPWQLKIFWAKAADAPLLRARGRQVILAMQVLLTITVASFAIAPLKSGPMLWYGLTFLAAFLAATQDVFVDAFAVRVLRPDERGFGNTAQVAGYRLGMLVGGASLLILSGAIGERPALFACAAAVFITSLGAFFGTATEEEPESEEAKKPTAVGQMLKRLFTGERWPVIVLALTFKLGLHLAAPILKPMAIDYGWTRQQIGVAVVTFGSIASLAGAAAGGALHRVVQEKRALVIATVFHAAVCAPLILVNMLHAPFALTTVMIALEHFGSGLGTTVLFAALMTATRPADAGLHYTILTSANALAIGFGGLLGGLLADMTGKSMTFFIATLVCLAPLPLVAKWNEAAQASRS